MLGPATAAEIADVSVRFVDYSGPAMLSVKAADKYELRINIDPQSERKALTLQVELPIANPHRLWTGKGCQTCNNTGYSGRTGIYEIILVTDQLHAPIVHGPDIAAIRAMVHKQGMPTMFQDGLQKALNGVTTLEEILRVTGG